MFNVHYVQYVGEYILMMQGDILVWHWVKINCDVISV